MFLYGPLHIDVPGLADQQEIIHISFVQTQNIISKTCRKRLVVGWIRRERQENLCCHCDLIMMANIHYLTSRLFHVYEVVSLNIKDLLFSMKASTLYWYHLLTWSNPTRLHNSQCITIPAVSVLLFFLNQLAVFADFNFHFHLFRSDTFVLITLIRHSISLSIIGLVSLFNGISSFVDYFMPKTYL